MIPNPNLTFFSSTYFPLLSPLSISPPRCLPPSCLPPLSPGVSTSSPHPYLPPLSSGVSLLFPSPLPILLSSFCLLSFSLPPLRSIRCVFLSPLSSRPSRLSQGRQGGGAPARLPRAPRTTPTLTQATPWTAAPPGPRIGGLPPAFAPRDTDGSAGPPGTRRSRSSSTSLVRGRGLYKCLSRI